MATPIVTPKATYWSLYRLPYDGKRYQIFDGELYVTPSPNLKHQQVVGNLYLALRTHCDRTGAGKVFLAPFDVVLDEFNVLQPDLLFVRKERVSVITTANVWGAPDLAIEVFSPSTVRFDRGKKLPIYARFGVPELWYVDPESEVVEVLNLTTERQYAPAISTRGDERLVSSVLPDLSLTAREVFA